MRRTRKMLSSRLADFTSDELARMLAAYRADPIMSAATWRIQEIQNEIHSRAADITLAIDDEFRLIVRTPDDSIGQEIPLKWGAARQLN